MTANTMRYEQAKQPNVLPIILISLITLITVISFNIAVYGIPNVQLSY